MNVGHDGNGRGQLGRQRLAARREFGSPHQIKVDIPREEEPLAGTGRGGESLPTNYRLVPRYTTVPVGSAGKPLDALEETPEKGTRLPAVGCVAAIQVLRPGARPLAIERRPKRAVM